MQGVSRNGAKVVRFLFATIGLLVCVQLATLRILHAEPRRDYSLGIGLSVFNDGERDELRRPLNRSIEDANGNGAKDDQTLDIRTGFNAYLERYFSEHLGFGVRFLRANGNRQMSWGNPRSVRMFGQNVKIDSYEESVSVTHRMATVTWLLEPATGRTSRWGFTGGVGQMQYDYRQRGLKTGGKPFFEEFLCALSFYANTCDRANTEVLVNKTDTTTGAIVLAGTFFDFGGKVTGARLGLNRYITPGTMLNARQPQGGRRTFDVAPPPWELYINLRWWL